MRIPHRSLVTGAATLVVLASAASLALDPDRPILKTGVERTVALGDLCGATGCTIAYKSEEDGAPSRVVPAR